MEYFDINNQTTKVAQYILYSNDMSCYKLMEYIEHSFVPMNDINNLWCSVRYLMNIVQLIVIKTCSEHTL